MDQYAALTASSQLEKLVLVYREDIERLPLPRHMAFSFVFRSGLQLPYLTELVIDALDHEALEELASDDDDELFEGQEDPYCSHSLMDCMDFKDITVYCPNLKRLTLNSVVAAEMDQDIMIDLPRARKLQRRLDLEHLCLGGPWLTTASAAALATFTGLQHLELCNAPYLRANGLQQLTALQQQRLEVWGVGWGRQVSFFIKSTVSGTEGAVLDGSCVVSVAKVLPQENANTTECAKRHSCVPKGTPSANRCDKQRRDCLNVLDSMHFLCPPVRCVRCSPAAGPSKQRAQCVASAGQ
jgi:hypothetical protein